MDKTIKCPNCGQIFDNVDNEFLECANCGKKYKNPFFDNMAGAQEQEQEQNDSSSVEQETEEPTNNEVADESVDGKQIGVEEQQTKDTKDTKAKKSNEAKCAEKNNDSDSFMRVITNTIKEFFAFKQFKRIHVGLAVCAGILMSPFLFAVIAMIPAFYILQFCYKMVSAPADYLLQAIRNEGQSTPVKAVVYFVGYPTVFLMKIALSVFSVEFFVMYFFFMLFAYIYGFGGIKFQPFIFEASTDCSAHLEEDASAETIAIILTVTVLLGVFYVGLGLGIGLRDVELRPPHSSSSSSSSSAGTISTGYYESMSVRANESSNKTYYFTPTSSGTYRITVSSNDNGASIYIYIDGTMITNGSNYSISGTKYCYSGSKYTIRVNWSNYSSTSDSLYVLVEKV